MTHIRVWIIQGKQAIGVRVIKVLLYINVEKEEKIPYST